MYVARQTAILRARQGSRKARSFLRRALVAPRLAAAWLAFAQQCKITQHCRSDGLTYYMSVKPLKPYLRNKLGAAGRMRLLTDHYDVAAHALPAWLRSAVLDGDTHELAGLRGRSGQFYVLTLAGPDEAAQEGELAMKFARSGQQGEPATCLAKLSFVFGRSATGTRILIGGLQGASGPEAKADIIHTTRDLRGLRPKAAVFLAVQAMAEAVGCEQIEAASNLTHISHEKAPTYRRHFHADYDAFWRDRQGRPAGDMGFTFAISTASRNAHGACIVRAIRDVLGQASSVESDRVVVVA